MEYLGLICILLSFCVVYLAYQLIVIRRKYFNQKILPLLGNQPIKASYFSEVQISKSLFKKSSKVTIKCQFYYNDLPMGPPFVVSESFHDELDEKRVDKMIEDIAKPLVKAGLIFNKLG